MAFTLEAASSAEHVCDFSKPMGNWTDGSGITWKIYQCAAEGCAKTTYKLLSVA